MIGKQYLKILVAIQQKKKAKEAIVEALREVGEAVLTLEIYDTQDKPNYIYGIEEYNLDE